MAQDEEAVYDFTTELLQTRQVSDANFKRMVDLFGERQLVELIGLMGHFHSLSMLFAVDKYPVPTGAPDAVTSPR
jgi:4-carboxymuconolactone decarboxylase